MNSQAITSETRIDEILKERASAMPEKAFIHFADTTYTYAEVDAAVDAYADMLRTHTIENRFVGLSAWNTPAFIYGYFAILRAHGRVVPLNPRLGPDEVRYMMKDAHIKACLCADGCTSLLPEECTEENDSFNSNIPLHYYSVPDELQGTAPEFPENLSECAVCIYTSGTTGRPKGAVLTHEALLQNARICTAGLESTYDEECFVTVLPLFHAFAASACMLHALWCASRILLIPEFKPLEVLTSMAQHKATVFLGVPAMYAVLAQIEQPPDIPSWRICVSGGAPMSAAIHSAFQKRYDMDILEGDGPTECGPATSVNPVGGIVKPGTIGLPLPDVEMKIADDDMHELACNEIGEIIVKSPSNFSGYINNPEATKETLVDGWVRTGDVGDCDEDGYFRIVDRKKDMIIVGGLNVYSQEVEYYLSRHPAIQEAAVIGRKDDVRGEVPVAFVALAEGAEWDEAEVRRFLRERIARYKVPKEYIVLETFPRNATGKIMKRELRTVYKKSVKM